MDIFSEVGCAYKKFTGKKCVLGYSFLGREIFAFHVGADSGRQFIFVYGVHAREWITARLAISALKERAAFGGWIIPLLNPDGALISQTKIPIWKANARGVDLNCNFDAEWGKGRLNTSLRGAQNCIGDAPLSEPESRALARFTMKIKPAVTVSFHTKGGEIYWEFAGLGDRRGAQIISAHTGYKIKKIVGSCGGYKDWCIQKLGIPAYTVECGSDELTHPIERLSAIGECRGLLKFFTENYEK